MRSILYPLAAGNTCIFKGSEFCPRTWWALGSVLTEAGLPAGALNVLFHRPEDAAQTTTALIEHRCIKKINFTGKSCMYKLHVRQTLNPHLQFYRVDGSRPHHCIAGWQEPQTSSHGTWR